MNSEEYFQLVNDLFEARMDVHKKKAHDYANSKDVLSNFKRLAMAAGALNIDVRSPVGYSLFMCLMKLDRLNNLISQDLSPSNESLDDTFIDIQNYVDLARAILIDEQDK